MSNPFIGRRESIGVGIETTPGTSVAPAAWQKHMKFDMDPKTTVAQDKSGIGRVENIHDSAVTEQWAEGSLNGNISDLLVGYFIKAIMGSCSTALHSSETAVWDNTFTVNQAAPPPTLTLVRNNPIYEGRYPMCVVSDLEFDMMVGGYSEFTATLMSKVRVSSTDTVAYATQNKFTSKHVTPKIAATIGALSGATAPAFKSLKLKLSRNMDRFTPLGAIDPISFDPESFAVTGEAGLRFTDTTFEALGIANTLQAMSISLVNTDQTIGVAANPGLVFTMPQVRFTPLKLDDNLDQPLSQTIPFVAELNTGVGYMLQTVLTNIQNGY